MYHVLPCHYKLNNDIPRNKYISKLSLRKIVYHTVSFRSLRFRFSLLILNGVIFASNFDCGIANSLLTQPVAIYFFSKLLE